MTDTGFDLEPEEFTSFVTVMTRQSSHVQAAKHYAENTCGDTSGLDSGVLQILKTPIETVAGLNATVYDGVRTGTVDIRRKVRDARNAYRQADADAAAEVSSTFVEIPRFMPELVDYQGTPSMHGYSDGFNPDFTVPGDGGEQIEVDVGGVLGALDSAWQLVFDTGLLAQIVEPIAGNYGRLKWLSTAYKTLGTATYNVAWNMRSGTRTLASSWHGEASAAFQVEMFRWHMGLGGVGDAQHLISQALKWSHDTVKTKVEEIIEKINALIEKAGKILAKKASPWGWALTVVDVVASGFDLSKVYDDIVGLRDDVQAIINAIEEIRTKLREFKEQIDDAIGILELAAQAARAPSQVAAEVEGFVEDQMGSYFTTFERSEDYQALNGVARVALLPLGP